MKILAHAPFIGTTGYANHARSFLCALNKYHTVKVRNFTIGNGWDGMSNTPHDKEPYITDEMKDMLILQTLTDVNGKRSDYPMYNYDGNFKPDINIILQEVDHHYFYDNYEEYTIAYNVYESTRYSDHFFNRLIEFDEVWVPTQWQHDSFITQGGDPNKVNIVPEGVDINVFKPTEIIPKKDKFRFLLFGRWDYRKSTTEVLKTFGETFKDNPNVELIASVENPYPSDETRSTKDRIKKYDIHYDNIKFVKFTPRKKYIKYLQEGDVFLSCARSEGWNLPLIEALSCGTPSLYSNWGGQLQFAEGKGIPVEISHLRSANIGDREVGGQYCEPDFHDLSKQMLDVYNNYTKHKQKALEDSKIIHKDFNWDQVAKIASDVLEKKDSSNSNVIEKDILFYDSKCFYTQLNEITDMEDLWGIQDTTMGIAHQYGWPQALFHEIYNIQDYYFERNKKINDGDIVVDVGANIGVFTRWAYYQGAKKVISFEPDKRYYKLLKLNANPQSILFNAAISNEMGYMTVAETDHLGGSFVFNSTNNTEGYNIRTYTLDYLFETKLIDHIDFLKIDIEGGEHLALEGISDENLMKVNNISMEYHHLHLNFDENLRNKLTQRLHKLGFNSQIMFLGDNLNLQMIHFTR